VDHPGGSRVVRRARGAHRPHPLTRLGRLSVAIVLAAPEPRNEAVDQASQPARRSPGAVRREGGPAAPRGWIGARHRLPGALFAGLWSTPARSNVCRVRQRQGEGCSFDRKCASAPRPWL
jgi:hypothetical protein